MLIIEDKSTKGGKHTSYSTVANKTTAKTNDEKELEELQK